jgi:hypothetical protein
MRGVFPVSLSSLCGSAKPWSRESCEGGFLWHFTEETNLLGQKLSSLLTLLGWNSNLSCIPGGMTDTCECGEEHVGITEVDAMSWADAALHHRWYVQISRPIEQVSVQFRFDGIHRGYRKLPVSSFSGSHWSAEGNQITSLAGGQLTWSCAGTATS